MKRKKTSEDNEEIEYLLSPFKKSDSISVTNPWKIITYILTLAVLILALLKRKAKCIDEAKNSTVGWNHSMVTYGWNHSMVTYGLVHMARSGGSVINHKLALKYERVCGNKGSSYNAYEQNEKKRLHPPKKLTGVKMEKVKTLRHANKIGTKHKEKLQIQGFDDCDYIAMEDPAVTWQLHMGDLHRPLELHVPCRDPIDHLMSMCAFRNQNFRCNVSNKELQIQVDGCILHNLNRFSIDMAPSPNFTMKCFSSPSKIDSYIEYMGERLQKKRIQGEYFDVTSNKFTRHKETECIWKKANEGVRIRLEEIIFNHTSTYVGPKQVLSKYFKYCKYCIGSENDLLRYT